MSSSSSDTLFQLRQSAILLLTAMIWGATFVAQSLGMDSVGPFTFTTTRMLLGAFFLLPIVLLRRKRLAAEKPAEAARRSAPQYRRTLLMGGILCGLCLFGGESLQQFGFVHDTEVGKSGFITALYIVFVPIISLFLGRRGSPLLWAAVALSLVGLWFLCIPPEGFTIAAGDLFVLACAVVFSLHILVIGRYVLLVDAVELSMMQFFCGSILAFFAMLALESPTWIGWQTALPAMLWAGIMSNGIAYTLQIVGQRGTLSAAMAELAERTLKHHGHCVVVTDLNEPYVVADEVKKILEADVLIFQTPGWWMTTPWQLIKYEDDVFVSPELCGGDGRTRSDPEKKYGSGGFLTNKRYVLSTTWNAPLEAFTDPHQFFEGKGLDGLFMPFHKTMQFLGLKAYPSFMVNDVFKHPTIEADFKRWEAYLTEHFGQNA